MPVPQSRDECVEAIAEIGRRQRERTRIQAAMNDALAELRQGFEEQALPETEAIRRLSEGVKLFCAAHRVALTDGGKTKSVNLASGWVKWRLRPPSVRLTGVEAVLQLLRKMHLERFIRVKEEVDKEAILADPTAIEGLAGIRIEQKEDFVIEPFETELEEVM